MSRVDVYQRAIQLKAGTHGWCSDEKSTALVDSVLDAQVLNWIPTIVEIGVFGGQSLYAFASAAAASKGHVWGIDPWAPAPDQAAYADDEENRSWWAQIDYELLYRGCLQWILDNDLQRVCTLLRMTSRRASTLFADESIDILHIDGNHAPVSSTFDVVTWIPKVRFDGYVWFDDIDWKQTNVAYELAKMQCKLIKEVGNCALLQRQGRYA